jgi:hypothetical protein
LDSHTDDPFPAPEGMEELYKEIREMGEGKPGHEALKSRVGKHICERIHRMPTQKKFMNKPPKEEPTP